MEGASSPTPLSPVRPFSSPSSSGPHSPFRIKRYGDRRALRRHPALIPGKPIGVSSPNSQEQAFKISRGNQNTSPVNGSDTLVGPPPHKLLHTGNKLFWRVNRTIDFRILVSEAVGAVILRSYDSFTDLEFKPLIMRLETILMQVAADDAAQSAISASMTAVDRIPEAHEEDEVMKERRKQKKYADAKREAEKLRSEAQNSRFKKVATKKDHVEEVERKKAALKEKGEMWAKVISFCIGRLDVEKDTATGAIAIKLSKRPQDVYESLEFADVPVGVEDCGSMASWHRRESPTRITRKATELTVAVNETSASTTAAGQRQRATQIALDIFRSLADRAHLEALPKHQRKYHAVVKKAIFQRRLESLQGTLMASPAFQEFNKSLPR